MDKEGDYCKYCGAKLDGKVPERKDGDAHDATEAWPYWKKRAALSNYKFGKDDAND